MEIEGPIGGPRTLVDKLQFYFAGTMLLAIAGVMIYVVVMRYYFHAPPLWGEAVPRIIFVWMVFLSAGYAIQQGLNIRVTMLVDRMPPLLRRVVETAMHLIVLAMLAVIAWQSFAIIRLHLGGTMLATGMSEAILSIPMPIGCAIMAIAQTSRLIAVWRAP